MRHFATMRGEFLHVFFLQEITLKRRNETGSRVLGSVCVFLETWSLSFYSHFQHKTSLITVKSVKPIENFGICKIA